MSKHTRSSASNAGMSLSEGDRISGQSPLSDTMRAPACLAGCGKTHISSVVIVSIEVSDDNEQPCRMLKKAVRQGRSERGDEAYSFRYVEPPSDARTQPADFFSILLDRCMGFLTVRLERSVPCAETAR